MESRFGFISFFVVLMTMAFMGDVFAYEDYGYPYKKIEGCVSSCSGDVYNFCQNNCTSFCAFMLNRYIEFNNTYRQTDGNTWGSGGDWNNAAERAHIPVDNNPIPQDVAYWEINWTDDPENVNDDYGHVAWVEKVYYDHNGNVTSIDVVEYNYTSRCRFSSRNIEVGDNNYPNGFIHILAFEEGVTSFHYLDLYEMGNINDSQTPEE